MVEAYYGVVVQKRPFVVKAIGYGFALAAQRKPLLHTPHSVRAEYQYSIPASGITGLALCQD